MAFRVITDMKEADEYWAAGLLYFEDDGQWIVDDYYMSGDKEVDWRPSADEEREGARNNKYAIFVEE